MKYSYSLFSLGTAMLLTACTPHPASGVWTTTEDNAYGISKLVVGFEGRANFVTPKLDNSEWRCFWSATSKQETTLDCTPSTAPEQEERFLLTINAQGMAELQHDSKLVAIFTLQDENPSPEN
jgi:hypothetical protein